MNIGLHKFRYVTAAARSKISLFVRQPGALLFYTRHYSVEKRVMHRVAVTIVSYPKSGRTWLEQLLLAALGQSRRQTFDPDSTYTYTAAGFDDIPLVAFTHAGGSWETATFTAQEIAGYVPPDIVQKRFVYLYRDPRDVIVSAYYHARYRTGISWLRPADMLSDPIIGLPKTIAFMNNWIRLVDAAPGRAIRVSYELLKDAPEQTLQDLCRFMQLPFSPADIKKAVEACTFEQLQKREKAASGNNPWLAPGDPNNPESFKFREGRSGTYKSFFEPAQIEWIEQYMRDNLVIADEYLDGN